MPDDLRILPTTEAAWRRAMQLPGYDPWRDGDGLRFDPAEATRAIEFFHEMLRHGEGAVAGKPFLLERWQQAVVGNLFGWFRKDGTRRYREGMLYVPRKNGKALDLETPIPTPSGWTVMGDLRDGDTVYGASGEPCRVVRAHAVIPEPEAFEVVFSNGERVQACADHLWVTVESGVAAPRSTRTLYNSTGTHTLRGRHKGVRVVDVYPIASIPMRCITVDSPTHEYLCGRTMIPTHNSPLVAGIVLCVMVCDGEKGAQLYSAAAEKEQAALLFKYAAGMVYQNPELDAGQGGILTVYGGMQRRAMVYEANMSAYRALSADAATKHGLTPSVVIIDEEHALPNRELVDTLATGMASLNRRNPLLLHVTTADYDRPSICNEKHAYACKVRDGEVDDPYFLPVVYEAKSGPYTETLHDWKALERLDGMCTCECAPTIQTEKALREACARLAIASGTEPRTGTTGSGAESTQADKCGQGGCAHHATNSSCSTETRSTRSGRTHAGRSGPRRTQNESRPPVSGGEPPQEPRTSCQTSGSETSTESAWNKSAHCTKSRADVPFAAATTKTCAWIIATIRDECGDSCAASAIAASVCSEMIPHLYGLHSPTCGARQNTSLAESSLRVHHPDGDDWTDEAVWEKANPNLDVSVSREYLRAECAKAMANPALENTFRRLHLNQKTTTDVRWMPLHVWDDSSGLRPGESPEMWRERMLGELQGATCVVGLDLSQKVDITACVALFPPAGSSEAWHVLPWFWVPGDNARAREKKDRVPYLSWARMGFCELTEGDWIDQDAIREHVKQLCQRFDVREVAYDPWNAEGIGQALERENITTVRVRQGVASLSEPMKQVYGLTLAKHLHHGANPALRWMIGNTAAKTDVNGNIQPDKSKSTERIDGVSAMITAMARAVVLDTTPGWDLSNGLPGL